MFMPGATCVEQRNINYRSDFESRKEKTAKAKEAKGGVKKKEKEKTKQNKKDV